ncbi:sulfatase [Verrucomicrobia bacterium S94]|nr:sulfatase [Verrucomicrobia bacterium S94]
MKKVILLLTFCIFAGLNPAVGNPKPAAQKPNIIIYFADDISAREFPVYGSSVWSSPKAKNTSDPKYRAQTPVLERLAEEGVTVKTAWGATICSPSRAMMMTGRYAHLHKWWHNGDFGRWINPDTNRKEVIPLYITCPIMMGDLARQAGYGTYWAGKTQIVGDYERYGFDEGCFTPGRWEDLDNPYADFKLVFKKGPDGRDLMKNGRKRIWNLDDGKEYPGYKQHSWNFFPHVRVMYHPDSDKKLDWWPVTPEQQKRFGLHTYGADVELEHIFNFMDRQHAQNKPFLIYHTSHLGHDAFDFLHPESGNKWPGTPIAKWDGSKYHRVKTRITGDRGVYDTHGTVSEPGIHSHINYIDYQIWQYLEKLSELGIENNTVLIITADNGTSQYGKGYEDRQKGTHVPFIVYAPGFNFTKQGMQDILVNLADVYPTVADLVGTEIPEDYEVNGKSLWPYLTTDAEDHREWIYSYKKDKQFIRGHHVMRDGNGVWWDVSSDPADLISFTEITDWEMVPKEYREERDRLIEAMKPFDLYDTAHDYPGYTN